MKNYYILAFFCLAAILLTSCSKGIQGDDISGMLASKLTIQPPPNPTRCAPGYFHDPFSHACIAHCPTGYIGDILTGNCIVSNLHIFPYTNDQLFKGIFFFQGTVGQNIPYYNSIRSRIAELSPADQESLNNYINELTTTVNTLNPTYLDELSAKVQGNNPDSITDALDKGSGLIMSAVAVSSQQQGYINASNVYDQMNLSNYDFNTVDGINIFLKDYSNSLTNSTSVIVPDKSLCFFFAAVVAVAIWDALAAVNYGVIVNVGAIAVVWAAVYAKVVFWPKKADLNPDGPGKLEREHLVLHIQQNISNAGSGGGLGGSSLRTN